MKQNVAYCTKPEGRRGGPWIGGTCAETGKKGNQGQRTDLDDLAKAVFDAGGITDEIQEEYHGHTMRFGKLAKEAAAAILEVLFGFQNEKALRMLTVKKD